jgi:hypothetical protein
VAHLCLTQVEASSWLMSSTITNKLSTNIVTWLYGGKEHFVITSDNMYDMTNGLPKLKGNTSMPAYCLILCTQSMYRKLI